MDLKIKYVLLRFAPHIFLTKKKKIKKKVNYLVATGSCQVFFIKKYNPADRRMEIFFEKP